jgi:predicted MPP superfamily phosphohydrolase
MKMKRYRGKHNHFLRRLGECALDTALSNGILASVSHWSGLQGHLRVCRRDLTLSTEKRLSKPLTIAFASDLHAGPTTHPSVFTELFAVIAEHQPDVLLLGGDFVSCKAEHVYCLLDGLKKCNPPLGKYAVFGNHDLWVDDAHLTRALNSAGVRVLINENIALPAPFDTVSICGMDDPWTGTPIASKTFSQANATRILLMHSPDGLLFLGDEKFDIAFAGHTHGGQVALGDGTPVIVPNGPLCRRYHHGKFAIEGNGDLIVSRGVGCSTLPIRINADPELVICKMQ